MVSAPSIFYTPNLEYLYALTHKQKKIVGRHIRIPINHRPHFTTSPGKHGSSHPS